MQTTTTGGHRMGIDLLAAVVPTLYCASWVPWLRAVGTLVVVTIVILVVRQVGLAL
jgi:hypothetical protein